MSLAYWINTGWMWSCRREAKAFETATRSVAESQWAILAEIITKNTDSEFGQQYDFASIRSIAEFKHRVPIATHEQVAPAVGQIAAGHGNVLTCEPVDLLEPTSGSTSGEKLIPYTASLRRQFQRAVAVWIADVMKHRLGIRRGRAYWSISPAMNTDRVTSGGIRIGFDDDAAYLSQLERYFLKHLLVMPAGIVRLTSIENFRYCTLFHLLAAGDLSLISVWSPTFLTSLLSQIEPWAGRLTDDLLRGHATPPVSDDIGLSESVVNRRCSARRASKVGGILRSNEVVAAKLRQLWPHLDLLSCWADATAAHYVDGIHAYFPDVAVQPKGLMSTEACVSFPLVGHTGAALALRSHFFEFNPIESRNDCVEPILAHQLDKGQHYEVIVTTGGGLYRYRLGDIVVVVGFVNECPLLRFIGRAGCGSDLVGEKLSESHVSRVLRQAFDSHRIAPQFAMIVPSSDQPGYRLYLESDDFDRLEAVRDAILQDVTAGLSENPHFQYAVNLGQLGPLEIRVVTTRQPILWPVYERVLLERGLKTGDIKPTALDSWLGWHGVFEDVLAGT